MSGRTVYLRRIKMGEKGLNYGDGKRIYFPDKKWTDAKEGYFYNMEISSDKGSYAFITGNMVNSNFMLESAVDVTENLALLTIIEVFDRNIKFRIFTDRTFEVIGDLNKERYVVHNTENGYCVYKAMLSEEEIKKEEHNKVLMEVGYEDIKKEVSEVKACSLKFLGEYNKAKPIFKISVNIEGSVYRLKMLNIEHRKYEENAESGMTSEVKNSWNFIENVLREYGSNMDAFDLVLNIK